MRALIVFVLAASLAVGVVVAAEDVDKSLKSQLRQKRGGWGYDGAYTTYVTTPTQHLSVIQPHHHHHSVASIATTSVLAGPHHVVYPQTVAVAAVAPASESVVWQTGANYNYYVHQRHPYYNSQYQYYYPTSSHFGHTHYITAPTSGW